MKRFISFLLVMVMSIGVLSGCAREEMNSDELTAKRIIEQSDEDIGEVDYVNFLEEANNGNYDYYYYDVIAKDGGKYIVELKDTGTKKKLEMTREYNSKADRKEHLRALIEYRCSKFGSN